MFSWLKKLFKKKTVEAPKAEPTPQVEKPSTGNKIKIALLPGHGAGDSGATGKRRDLVKVDEGIFTTKEVSFNEHDYVAEVCELVAKKLPNVGVFYKSKTGGWATTYLKVIPLNPDFIFEVHLNAFNGQAKGCEVLITQEKTRRLAESFSKAFTEKFDRVLRATKGVKKLESGDRGSSNVKGISAIAPYAMLTEAFFCDNPNEYVTPEEYAEFFADWLSKLEI